MDYQLPAMSLTPRTLGSVRRPPEWASPPPCEGMEWGAEQGGVGAPESAEGETAFRARTGERASEAYRYREASGSNESTERKGQGRGWLLRTREGAPPLQNVYFPRNKIRAERLAFCLWKALDALAGRGKAAIRWGDAVERLRFQVGGAFFDLGFRAFGRPGGYSCRGTWRYRPPGGLRLEPGNSDGSAPSHNSEFTTTRSATALDEGVRSIYKSQSSQNLEFPATC